MTQCDYYLNLYYLQVHFGSQLPNSRHGAPNDSIVFPHMEHYLALVSRSLETLRKPSTTQKDLFQNLHFSK
jgi:hypothetical protein